MGHFEGLAPHSEIKGPTDRAFGLTVGGILVAIALIKAWWSEFGWFGTLLAMIGVPLIGFGAMAPTALAPLNKAWTRFGLLLARVVNPIVMSLLFFTTIVPIGLLMRLFGADPLRLRFAPREKTYWLDREPGDPSPKTMSNQF